MPPMPSPRLRREAREQRGLDEERRFLCNGEWLTSDDKQVLKSPYDRQPVAVVCRAAPEHVEAAIEGAQKAFETTKKPSSFRRSEILKGVVDGLRARVDEIARQMTLESGKAIKDARTEVQRAVHTFTNAVEESKRIGGEVIDLGEVPHAEGRWGLTRRFPIGVVAGISPFNFPLNLVAHKIAPAIASGNTIVLKPASQTPLSALTLGEICHKAGAPPGSVNILPCSPAVAAPLVEDDRVKMVSFTGSPDVGWGIKERCRRKKVVLELGGNAGVIIDRTADLSYAVPRCVAGAFGNAGQSCISVQRMYVHEAVYDVFVGAFLKGALALKVGNPLDDDTDVGPMIALSEAERAESWLKEALSGGAKLLCGGERDGALMQPTVLENVAPSMKVSCLEVFAPVVTVDRFSDIDDAIRAVGDSTYGLQAGIFTNDLRAAMRAFEEIEVGGFIVNDVPTYRVDQMPYGGVKGSGLGREGVRYAIEEMTEPRLLMFNRV
jgi:acyl-CoA reductase-like NAD-dependent aldehyde dehydrogenase